jgi:hypothetical protein
MNYIKGLSSSKQTYSLAPAKAALLGIAIGLAGATGTWFMLPRDFSFNVLLVLLLGLVPFCGIGGYMVYLAWDPVRANRLARITGFIALPTIIGLIVAFREFWRTGLAETPLIVAMLLGLVWPMAMFAAAAGLGIAHLGGHMVTSFQRFAERGVDPATDGVWDRDLDRGA